MMATTMTVGAAVTQAGAVATWFALALGVMLAIFFGPKLLRLAVRTIKGR